MLNSRELEVEGTLEIIFQGFHFTDEPVARFFPLLNMITPNHTCNWWERDCLVNWPTVVSQCCLLSIGQTHNWNGNLISATFHGKLFNLCYALEISFLLPSLQNYLTSITPFTFMKPYLTRFGGGLNEILFMKYLAYAWLASSPQWY